MPEGTLSAVIELSPASGDSLRRVRPCFWPSKGTDADRENWVREVARRRSHLDKALSLTEDAALKSRIEAVLGGVPAR